MKTKVWIITEMFYPEQVSTANIMTCIADKISKQADVHVICSSGQYSNIIADTEKQFDFKIHRIKTPSFSKNNLAGRLIRLVVLSLKMFLKGLYNIKKEDKVFIVTNPAFIIPLFSIVKLVKRNELTILVHDVFPENAVAAGIINSNSVKYRLLLKIFNWGYNKADKLVVLGRDMLEIFKTKTNLNQPVHVIQNWADIDLIKAEDFSTNPLISEHGLKEKIVFAFAGNLGRVQGLEELFVLIGKVTNPIVHFIFIGDGAITGNLKKYVAHNKIQTVTFVDSMPRSKQNIFLNACHVGLVTLNDNFYGLGVPSKSYNIMAAGKPILFLGNKESEIATIIRENDCGYVFDIDDKNKLLNFFNNLNFADVDTISKKGLKSRALAETSYSRDIILEKFNSVILND
jgi:hypothetical protein